MVSFYRFEDRVRIDALSSGFSAAVSGGAAYGEAFVPGCVLDSGSRMRLRIALPGGGAVDADGRVRRLRGNLIPPGCVVSWDASSAEGADEVRKWLKRRTA